MTNESELILFVKAPLNRGDKESMFGEDIFAHRFMLMIAKKQIPNSKVIPVDPVYKKDILSTFKLEGSYKLPFIVHVLKDTLGNRVIVDDPPQIESYLEEHFQPYMKCNNETACHIHLNVFQKFIFYIKAPIGSPTEATKLSNLNKELKNINDHLAAMQEKFLGGDTITIPDCNLLPKLHYIRVAGKYFKKYFIPVEFEALQKYMKAGDDDDAFQDSKCTDMEIVEGFRKYTT